MQSRGIPKSLRKRLADSRAVQKTLGIAAAEYLRLVWNTNRLVFEPLDIYERIAGDLPIIVAMWHGQHFLLPFIKRSEHRAKVLISRHRDGEINAIAAERLGVGTIRGSGAHGGEFTRKGGIEAFKQMLAALKEGYSLAVTADVPKISRIAGRGIVFLARASGRPILPVAVATSRRIELDNWDRSTIGLPFGRIAVIAGDLIRVPERGADDLESYRKQVEEELNAVTRRSYELVDVPAR
jgi:lysophospholipid acyltransferase (LPLAT)-like uncharacterized protein